MSIIFNINKENVFPVQLVKPDTIPELDVDHVLAPPPDHVLLVQDAGVVNAAVIHGECSSATLHFTDNFSTTAIIFVLERF